MSDTADVSVKTSAASTTPVKVPQTEKSARKPRRAARRGPPICRYFQQGKTCRSGDECPFLHTTPPQIADKPPTGKQGKGNRNGAKAGKSFRKTQIESLLKASKWVVKRLSSDRDVSAFAIEMKPSDPDFPYDVTRIYMAFLVPAAYPTTRSSDDTISIHIANKDIPTGVKHNIETGFAKHARNTSNTAIDAGNPENIPSLGQYIDWLDTNLELLMQQKPASTIKFTNFADQSKQKTAEKQPLPQQETPAPSNLSNVSSSSNSSSSSSNPGKMTQQEVIASKLKNISSNFNRAIPASRPPASRPVPEPMFSGIGSNKYADQDRRLTELLQMERRFRTSYNVLRDDSSEGTVVSVNFAPTDPDLREYDIYKMTAILTVSHTYPKPPESFDVDPSSPVLPAASLTIDPDSISGCKSKDSIWHPAGGRQAYIDYICHRFNEHVVETPHTSLLHHLNWLDRHIVGMIATPPPTDWIQRKAPAPTAADRQQQSVIAPTPKSKTKLFEEGLNEDKPWIKTISLKEAGLPEELNNMQISSEHDGTSDNDSDESSSPETSKADDKPSESDSESDSGMLAKPARRGTEICFGIVQLTNISLAHCHSLNVAVRCSRCKSRVEIKGIPQTLRGGKENQTWKACDTCSTIVGVRFRPDWMFMDSTTLGYLDCSGCAPIDLMPSKFTLTCESCAINDDIYETEMGYEESEETKKAGETIASIGVGSRLITNCRRCYGRIGITLQEPRFTKLQSGIALDGNVGAVQIYKEAERARKNKVSKREELARLGVVPGEPLPNHGACKHFRKSNRWLRFPCCGKTFPCVTCHDEKEGHDHAFAQIMLCGFCAKEQRISKAEKTGQCIACGSQVIKKIDGNNAFWQGGTGVRDQTRMNRNDTKKFKGQNKTIANKKVGISKK
ncbi:hypothetical protein IW140_003926 [Coemansia sp. RSA 1813]|nr:hypothetical protein EV178_003737 [Coemansia sp. RSA 1646]KAJ2212215.1 hypothetical protein EV179_004842 [Coemansia sp. RSA 487]KAJ2568383.1 hypothetical protein IW140_003926 [Coemansia sp. RSA 1813]